MIAMGDSAGEGVYYSANPLAILFSLRGSFVPSIFKGKTEKEREMGVAKLLSYLSAICN